MDAPAAAAEAAVAGPVPGEGGGGTLRRRAPAPNAVASTGASSSSAGGSSSSANARAQTTAPPARTRSQQDVAWLRERVIVPCVVVAAAAVATTALCAIALLSGRTQTLAVAAFVATLSSALLVRFAMQLSAVAAAHPHFRRAGAHRLTGERAAYVRTSQRLAMMDRDFTAADYEMLLDLDNNSTRLRRFLEGASQEFIDRLPTYTYRPSDSDAPPTASAPPPSPPKASEERSASTSDLTCMSGGALCARELVAEPLPAETTADDASKHGKNPELGGDTLRWCAICLDEFEPGMLIRVLPCWHRFMARCIDPWLLEKAECPICKASCLRVE